MNSTRLRFFWGLALLLAPLEGCSTSALRPCPVLRKTSTVSRTLRLAEGEPGAGAAVQWGINPSTFVLHVTVPNPVKSFEPQIEFVREEERISLNPFCASWKPHAAGQTWVAGIRIPPEHGGQYYLCISVKSRNHPDIQRECATRVNVQTNDRSKYRFKLSNRRPDQKARRVPETPPPAVKLLHFKSEAVKSSRNYLLSRKRPFVEVGSGLISFFNKRGKLKQAFRLGQTPSGYLHRGIIIGESAIVLASTGSFVYSRASSGGNLSDTDPGNPISRFSFVRPPAVMTPPLDEQGQSFSLIYSNQGKLKGLWGGPRHEPYTNDSFTVESENLHEAVLLFDRPKKPVAFPNDYQGVVQAWSENGESIGGDLLIGWEDKAGKHAPLIPIAGISDDGRIQIQATFDIGISSPILAITYNGDEFWLIKGGPPLVCQAAQEPCPEFLAKIFPAPQSLDGIHVTELRSKISPNSEYLVLNFTLEKDSSEHQEILVMDRYFRIVWRESFAPSTYAEMGFDQSGNVVLQRNNQVEIGKFEFK